MQIKQKKRFPGNTSLNSKSITRLLLGWRQALALSQWVCAFLCSVRSSYTRVPQWSDQPLKLIEFPRWWRIGRLHAGCWLAKLTWKWPWRQRCILEYLNGWAPWELPWIPPLNTDFVRNEVNLLHRFPITFRDEINFHRNT